MYLGRYATVMDAEMLAIAMAWQGVREGKRNAAGIKHEFRVTLKSKQVPGCDREALKGHTYIYTDRGPFHAWLHKIGREDSPMCLCGQAI